MGSRCFYLASAFAAIEHTYLCGEDDPRTLPRTDKGNCPAGNLMFSIDSSSTWACVQNFTSHSPEECRGRFSGKYHMGHGYRMYVASQIYLRVIIVACVDPTLDIVIRTP